MSKIIITHSDKGQALAQKLTDAGLDASIVQSPQNYEELWNKNEALIFIGSLGICVRKIAPFLNDKKTDPAVINMDANGQFVQAVVSGHLGGANQLSEDISRMLGTLSVVTTVSDTSGLWALDLLPKKYNWTLECGDNLTSLMAAFVNGKKTALLLDIRDKGTLVLETEMPTHVDLFFKADDIKPEEYDVVLAVTPFIYDFGEKVIYYRPKVMQLGVGCQKDLSFESFEKELLVKLEEQHISSKAIAAIGTVDLKANEKALIDLSKKWDIELIPFSNEILSKYDIPNPSQKVNEVTGSFSVSEASAMHLSENQLIVEKVKAKAGEKHFTFAVAIKRENERTGFVEFVGAGPGDPELVSVRGKRMLQSADMILYAGSLVPKELTNYAKNGCVVVSSAGMDLITQIETMKPIYDRGLFVVRLHTGDPCIYGAIQEQMAIMDQLSWKYHITPGISSFQAAAAALESQFTIPEEVQTIILTRGEGRTPMPAREQLHKLAKSQSTMCIYLSASIADKVQAQLSEHYPPETPVAVCYKLTWKDEKIYRCTLETLAKTVEDNNLKMTTLIVVGKAIDNRSGFSKLYDKKFTHAFRAGK
ncbi:precorrin-4 C(11)-methyltransferase [Ancylomarina sp. 16SWW S1-10-2]|uniref:precorrin-4 C(11)-methyltransferase n=1 Tax=Ancylomarina sp. 16SWW S1-10-2 TaxID=2499681 RepID=UPI0012AE3631|nr:precorrin-4 C(11)-methyltransferase [Ancylomarina sp. 16SWW S1-10-2]MRT94625.1 precorrin-4 C(11)-methyltransferase [Ancylomarina sp. 16SWW S1-10-2]